MSPVPSSPTVHRHQLSAKLQQLRKATDLEIEQVTKELRCSQTRVNRIETGKGRAAAKPGDMNKLCTL
ncbi:helix-turn-helix domain-containing protein [Streptomyces gobiensis]|uniref:helix-turn-helix domain-containing protein n=1 Tax=Streptomyces gobiensis TaxID=2875706 RepID=UPI001E4BFE43|nr:helix-turn-helix transcriptional regulator [Streptomyces gobiensis]UGY90283.1 helix-turn-helix domain-containing protein [Streptomyces gobiensis]UGY94928.1 helix-turn-helix domain-containing protein [Streptomyces gobiensis]